MSTGKDVLINRVVGRGVPSDNEHRKGCDFCSHGDRPTEYYAEYSIIEISPISGFTHVEEYELDNEEFNFCPKCGRKVVKGDDSVG